MEKKNIQKVLSIIKGRIKTIKKLYQQTSSPYIKYYWLFLELERYWINKRFLESRKVILELLDLVRNNKSVYRRQRIGVVYDHLSRCEYYLGEYKKAIEASQNAQKHFNENSENYCIALEQEFYALFALEQYESSKEIAEKMLRSATRKELGEFRYAKYNYLLANALFKLHRFHEVLDLLKIRTEISKDRAGWENRATGVAHHDAYRVA